MVDGVHRGHHREQTLGRADVGRRLVPANVLLPGLKRHAQGLLAEAVDRDADDASREVALE